MGSRGPAPKAHRQRARDERRRQSEQTTIRADKRVRGPKLPADAAYGPLTVAFYDKLRRSPQSQVWEDTDWLLITDILLPLHNAFHSGRKSATAAAEMRQIMSLLGASAMDRQRMRLVIEHGPAEPVSVSTGAERPSLASRLQREDTHEHRKH